LVFFLQSVYFLNYFLLGRLLGIGAFLKSNIPQAQYFNTVILPPQHVPSMLPVMY
jgi:hypothetical protein